LYQHEKKANCLILMCGCEKWIRLYNSKEAAGTQLSFDGFFLFFAVSKEEV